MTTARPPLQLHFHPAEEILVRHAGGALPLARRVLVESHLAHCAACRAATAELARPGGRHLRALPETAVPAGLWKRIAAEVAQDTRGPRNYLADTPLPPAARAELAPVHQPLPWGTLGEAPAQITLLVADPENALELYLIRNPPATSFPYHRHLGGEDLLILEGGLADDYGHYGVGDFQHYAAGTAHQPLIDPGQECWAITCVEGGVAFTR